MRKVMAAGAIIGIVLLMGCLEGRTFTKVGTSSKLLGFESIGTQNATVERYIVNDVDAWYTVALLPLDDVLFNQVISGYGEIIEEGLLDGWNVYFTYESPEKSKIFSIIWFSNGIMYQIGNDAETKDYDVMYDLFKFYNNI